MKNFSRLFVVILLLFRIDSTAQLSICIQSVPTITQPTDTLYLAGNINGWNPADVSYRFSSIENGEYWLTIDTNEVELEYKITRGSWNTVECAASGDFIDNRNLKVGSADTIYITVEEWADKVKNRVVESTANAQVSIFDSAMYMPQLNRYRCIRMYLPQDYTSTKKSYPVMYVHDGQNVFDVASSFSGEWQVDETLTDLENRGFETAIVVAIDNGGEHRINEYTTYTNDEHGGGEGEAYLQFIVETLKPKIDSNFRTLADAQHTVIMGSSLGGLISHYAHFKYPNVFGKLGSFSASYWFSDEYFTFTRECSTPVHSKIYLLAGLQEWDSASFSLKMNALLINKGYTNKNLKMLTPADGQHAEWFWAREFEAAFLWLMSETNE